MSRSQFKSLALIVVLAAAYFIAAKLGLLLARVHPSSTAVWPPTGLALAAFLFLGSRVWPAVFFGAFLANITTAGSVATCLGIATGNTLEAVLGVTWVNRYCNGLGTFDRAADVFKFTLFAAVLSTMVSATIGVTSLALGGFAEWADYGTIWLTWWIGDAAGDVAIAPLLILWVRNPGIRWNREETTEAAILLLSIGLAGYVIFGLPPTAYNRFPFVSIPIFVWTAFRFGQRETATLSFLFGGMAIWGTLRGAGPFVMEAEGDSLLLIGLFICIVTVTAMALAAGVAERRRSEAVLRQSEEQLRRTVGDLESLSYSLAHDLRSPVLSIAGLTRLVMKDHAEGIDPTGRDFLERVARHAEQMDALIRDLLAYQKLGRRELNPRRVNLNSLFADALYELAEKIQAANARVEIAEPLPEIFVDPAALSQIVSNLISNAIKFVAPGASPRVKIWAEEGDKVLRIWVEDNGIGIAPEHRERIFRVFERLHGEDAYPGTGVGLAIVAKRIEHLGGRVGVESNPGGGSRFWIELPARSDADARPD